MAAVLRLAATQGGGFSREQARGLGMTNRQIDGGIAAGTWDRDLPGVLRAAAVPSSRLATLWAAVLWAGDGAVVSHASAANLWELDGVRAPSRPEITVPYHRSPRSPLVVVHRSLVLDRGDVSTVDGLPVTVPTRTIIDLAATESTQVLEVALESARHRGLTSIAHITRRLEAIGGTGRKRASRLRDLLDAIGDAPPAESLLEVKVARLLRDRRIATPVRQHTIRLFRRTFRVDFAWPAERVVLECDGRRHHATRADFQRDRTKWTALASGGFRVLVVTWDDVTRRRREVVDRVVKALAVAH